MFTKSLFLVFMNYHTSKYTSIPKHLFSNKGLLGYTSPFSDTKTIFLFQRKVTSPFLYFHGEIQSGWSRKVDGTKIKS